MNEYSEWDLNPRLSVYKTATLSLTELPEYNDADETSTFHLRTMYTVPIEGITPIDILTISPDGTSH